MNRSANLGEWSVDIANKKTRKTVLKYVISPIAAICGLVVLYLLFSRAYVQDQICREREKIRQQTEINSPHGIESIEMVIVGGISPDAVRGDGERRRRGEMFSLEHMWKDYTNVNLFEQAPRIEVPVYFFLGRHDFNAPTVISIRYYEQLDAPKGKQIVWFEDCAHAIPFEAPEEYSRMLIDKVLAETYPN